MFACGRFWIRFTVVSNSNLKQVLSTTQLSAHKLRVGHRKERRCLYQTTCRGEACRLRVATSLWYMIRNAHGHASLRTAISSLISTLALLKYIIREPNNIPSIRARGQGQEEKGQAQRVRGNEQEAKGKRKRAAGEERERQWARVNGKRARGK